MAAINERGLERAWLVGKAALATSFRSNGLITEYLISVIPTFLGAGIPLFRPGGPIEKLSLVENKPFDTSLMQIRYRNRPVM